MKSLLLLACLISSTPDVLAQAGQVRGVVWAGEERVPFAGIGVKGTTIGTTADETGSFLLKQVPAGEQVLVVQAAGAGPVEKKVLVKAGSDVQVQVRLPARNKALTEVVVSGTLQERLVSESPVAVEIYTPALFYKNPTPSVFEALQLVNGLQPQLNCNVCGTGDIHINGMEGPYTMVLVDGMPVVSGLATVYGLSGIPNSLVERIEVVKGPASTLYGSEAVAGLINIITKTPEKAPALSADVMVSSHQELLADLGLRVKAGKSIGLLSMSYFNFQDRRDVNHDNFTDIPLQHRISVFSKWSLPRREGRLASLAARYVYEDRWGGELQWQPRWRGTDSIYGESVYTARYELLGMYQLPFRRENVTASFSLNRHQQNSAYGNTFYLANQQIAFGQLVWDKRLHLRHNLVSGLSFRYTYYDDNTPATQTADSLHPANAATHTVLPGIFAQEEWKLNEHHTLLSGARLDYHSAHGLVFSPRLNYKWAPDAVHAFRFSAGNGYRVVNLFTEDHAALTGAREVVVRERLKPERSYNLSLHYQNFSNTKAGFITFESSIFYTYFTNKILPDFSTNQKQILYDNLSGYAITRGISVQADASFSFPFKFSAGATLLEAYQKETGPDSKIQKMPQLHAPAFSGKYTLSYTFRQLLLTVDFTGTIYGPMHLPVQEYDFRPGKSPWYAQHNAQVSRKFKQNLELYAGAKNLFNFMPQHPIMRPFDPFDKYIDQQNQHGYTFDPSYNYAPVQGRRFFAGARYLLPHKN